MAKDQFAFPQPVVVNGEGDICVAKDYFDCSGMTLRDYFAAKALQSFMNWSLNQEPEDNDTALAASVRYASAAYKIADAMLKAREAKAGSEVAHG